jgi:hypothetical protein
MSMPDLVRLYIRQTIAGFALATAFVALLLGADVGGLRHLILGSDVAVLATGMLVMFNGIVFSGVQFAIAIMRMDDSRDRPRGGLMDPVAIPVPVRVQRDPRRRD